MVEEFSSQFSSFYASMRKIYRYFSNTLYTYIRVSQNNRQIFYEQVERIKLRKKFSII